MNHSIPKLKEAGWWSIHPIFAILVLSQEDETFCTNVFLRKLLIFTILICSPNQLNHLVG